MPSIVRAGGREIRRPAARARRRRRRPRVMSAAISAPSDDLEQAHIAYAFPGLSQRRSGLSTSAQVYATALGGGMSSRLFQEVREKRGLCYSIYAFANGFQDGGFIGVYAGTGEAEAGEISAVIAGEMEALAGDADRRRSRARQGAAQIRPADGAGTPGDARRADRRPDVFLGRVLPVGGDRGAARRRRCRRGPPLRRARDAWRQRPAIAAVGPVGKLESLTTSLRAASASRAA